MYSKSTSALTLTSTPQTSSSSRTLPNQHSRQLPQQQQRTRAQTQSQVTQQHQSSRVYASSAELSNSDLPDLSYLSEDERKIIEAVLERQRAEEAKDSSTTFLFTNQSVPSKSNTNQNLSGATSSSSLANTKSINPPRSSLYSQGEQDYIVNEQSSSSFSSKISQRHSISDIAQEIKQRYGSIDTGNVCDICKKTKFTNSGVGHVCFNCKSRCCVRCSFKYSTKTKQIWSCINCKKKQDALIKSGQWLNSPILNKKNYASDYILNKAVAAGLANSSSTSSQSNAKSANTITDNTGQTATNSSTSKRQLPNISRIKQVSQDGESREHDSPRSQTLSKINNLVLVSNSAQSVPELINDNRNSNSSKTNTTSNTTTTNRNDSENSLLNQNRKSTRLKQPLVKQASLNNPPNYFKNLNNSDDAHESSLYENFSTKSNQTKSFTTSTQELRKSSINSNANDQFFSSPGSSISQLNISASGRSRSKAERLQDPLLLLKFQNTRISNSRLNSSNNLSETVSIVDNDESSLYDREKSLNQSLLKQQQQKQPDQSSILISNAIKPRPTLHEQRSKELLHTDSLSSDPSDQQQAEQTNQQTNLDELNSAHIRKHSSKKRSSRPRKQPTLPVLPTNANPVLLKHKLLARLSSKQHSLTSSDDENLVDDFELINNSTNNNNLNNNAGNINDNKKRSSIRANTLTDHDEIDTINDDQTDYLDEEDQQEVEEEEEEEEEDEVDEEDEELRSTTEYTTNDEMDLESASASLSANAKLNNINKLPNKGSALINQRQRGSLMEAKHQSIDDYLVQNLKKEEIFAAKMNKFLSPSNWQISSDGKRIIGHIILKRSMSNTNSVVNSSSSSTIDSSSDFNFSSSLGLKIIGGRLNPITNQLSAYVVKIKKDSVSDTVGRLQAGDEVVKWNGKLLRGLTFDEVYSIINKSKQDAQIELIVERILDDMEKEKHKNLLSNADSNLAATSAVSASASAIATNQLSTAISSTYKTLDQNNIPIGKIQLKLFHDSIDNKLYLNVLTINLNQQLQSNLECIFCKLHLLPNRKRDFLSKSSEVCNLDKTTGLYFINEAFTFESINTNDLEELYVQLDIFSNQNKQIFGKSNLDLSSEMFENQLINLEIYSSDQSISTSQTNSLARSKPNNGISIESLNSGSNNSRRRQLPQIPLDKQRESRDKVAVDLVEKARKIKLDMKTSKEQYSVSDSETMMSQFKTFTSTNTTEPSLNSIQNNPSIISPTRLPEPSSYKSSTVEHRQSLESKKDSLFQSNDNPLPLLNQSQQQQIQKLNQANKQFSEESMYARNVLSDSDYYEKEPAQPLTRRISNINSNELRSQSKYANEANINSPQSPKLFKASSMQQDLQKDKFMSPTSIKDLNTDFEQYAKNQEWLGEQDVKQQQQQQSKTKGSSQSIEQNQENSLYLNSTSNKQTTRSPMVTSPSQTFGMSFQPLANRSVPNTSVTNLPGSTRPEKLFSTRHLNQKTQNVILNSAKQQSANDLSNQKPTTNQTGANTGHSNRMANGIDIDSDGGSEHSQLSNGSKLSSTSVISAQSELIKGANNTTLTNTNKRHINNNLSNLTTSDGKRLTTVSTNATNSTTTTTTTVLNQVNNLPKHSGINPVQNILNEANNNANYIMQSIGHQQQQQQVNKGKVNSEKTDGTLSDSALTNPISSMPETANKKRRPSMAKALVILGLSKKSNSASNLTLGKRFGFARSEEYGVMPELRNRNLSPSSGDSSGEDKKPRLWSGALKLPHELPFNEFIENLGPGQKVSRQVLGLPCLGEIKMSMFIDKQKLNIEVVQVKNLKQKTGYRLLPNVYVKFYLFHGNVCAEKQKTTSQRRTLNPTYKETLKFETDYRNSVLQATVWGDYGKLDRKVFMGIAQIVLDDCNLTTTVVGWYKLYSVTSIITDFSTIASVADLSTTESGYSIASHKSVK